MIPLTKNRLSEPPGSVTDKPISTHASLDYRHLADRERRQRETAQEERWHLEAEEARRQREAADVRRQAATIPQFDPYAGQAAVTLTAEEQAATTGALERFARVSVRPKALKSSLQSVPYEPSNAYTRAHCRSRVKVRDQNTRTGVRVDRFVPCRNCEPCRKHLAEVSGRWTAENLGDRGYAYQVTEDEWHSRSRSGLAAQLKKAGARYVTVPLAGNRRAIIATEAVRPCVEVDTVDAARDAALNPRDESCPGRRESASCMNPSMHPPAVERNGRKVPQSCKAGVCKATTQKAIERDLMGDETAEGEWKRIGWHHAETVAELKAAADAAGLEVEPSEDGVAIPTDADPAKVHAYNLRIGFVPFAKSSRNHAGPPPLPIAEAAAYLSWIEETTPPAEVLEEWAQLALVTEAVA
jgi:hypothetical protein